MKGAIPAVAAKMPLIKEVQTKSYWTNITICKVESLHNYLRHQVRFMDKGIDGRIIYTDFDDDYNGNVKEHELVYGSSDLEVYRKRVTHYIKSQQHHMTIFKLRMNIPITASELNTLETMLFEQSDTGSRDHFEKVYGKQPLGKFIRSIIGLEVEAARKAFAKFINATALNPQQIRFVDTIGFPKLWPLGIGDNK